VGLVDAWLTYGDDDGSDLKKQLDLPQTLAGHDGREWEISMFVDVLQWDYVTAFVRLGTGKVV
jgi:hypothetical protein